jgi:hypothetical protein
MSGEYAPVDPAALQASIDDIDVFLDGGVPLGEVVNPVALGESIMLVVHELKRLRGSPPSAPAGVKVKPLEYARPFGNETLTRAETLIGDAIVWTHHEANGSWFWKLGDIASGTESNEAEAKKMLWATYESRIRSSLQPDTQAAAASAPAGDIQELASASVRPEPSSVELLRRCLDVLEGLAKDVDACAHLNDDFSQTSICTEIRRHLAKPPAGGVFQRLYDSEINFSVSTFWDGGFDAKLGDELNGFNAEANVRTMLEAEAWLERQAAELYPASTFATSHSSGQNLADANSIASAPAQAEALPAGVARDEVRRAASALLNNLWIGNYTGSRSFEENWREFDRRYPGVKWLHEALSSAPAQEGRS